MVRVQDQAKREKFLSTALRLFIANGVQNTSTAEIAKEAGTAAGTLFLYFPTKQALVSELLLNIAREQSNAVHAVLEETMTAREIFAAIWSSTIRWFQENPDAYQYLLQVRDSGMVAETVVQESGKFFDYYFLAIQKGLSEGSIQPYPPELIGDLLYHHIVVVMNLLRRQPDAGKHAEYIHLGFDIFWNGIKK